MTNTKKTHRKRESVLCRTRGFEVKVRISTCRSLYPPAPGLKTGECQPSPTALLPDERAHRNRRFRFPDRSTQPILPADTHAHEVQARQEYHSGDDPVPSWIMTCIAFRSNPLTSLSLSLFRRVWVFAQLDGSFVRGLHLLALHNLLAQSEWRQQTKSLCCLMILHGEPHPKGMGDASAYAGSETACIMRQTRIPAMPRLPSETTTTLFCQNSQSPVTTC